MEDILLKYLVWYKWSKRWVTVSLPHLQCKEIHNILTVEASEREKSNCSHNPRLDITSKTVSRSLVAVVVLTTLILSDPAVSMIWNEYRVKQAKNKDTFKRTRFLFFPAQFGHLKSSSLPCAYFCNFHFILKIHLPSTRSDELSHYSCCCCCCCCVRNKSSLSQKE